VDFGLSSTIVGQGGALSVKLLPYDKAYFTAMDPDFTWPENVVEDADGRPVVPVIGLRKETEFALS
jgi:hypothetical protein